MIFNILSFMIHLRSERCSRFKIYTAGYKICDLLRAPRVVLWYFRGFTIGDIIRKLEE